MTTLAVWTFPIPDAAREAETTLASLTARKGITVDDGAMLTWTASKRRPRTRELHSIALGDAVGGDFWAVLFAVTFLLPTLQVVGGTGRTAAGSVLGGVGIPDAFTDELRRVVVPGTSALALLTGDGTVPETTAAFATLRPRLTAAVLSSAHLDRLRCAFAG